MNLEIMFEMKKKQVLYNVYPAGLRLRAGKQLSGY